jgi:hypothetical protein
MTIDSKARSRAPFHLKACTRFTRLDVSAWIVLRRRCDVPSTTMLCYPKSVKKDLALARLFDRRSEQLKFLEKALVAVRASDYKAPPAGRTRRCEASEPGRAVVV